MTEQTESTEEPKAVPATGKIPKTKEEWAGYAYVIYADHGKEELEALLPWLEEKVTRLTANGSQRLRDRAAAGLAEVKRRLAEIKAAEQEAQGDGL